MRIVIVDREAARAVALKNALSEAGYEARSFSCANEHLADNDWRDAGVAFLHFSERQSQDWLHLKDGGGYRNRRVVLYAGGVTVWRHYVVMYQDSLHCKYKGVVGDPPERVVIDDFLRYLEAVKGGEEGPLCDILNGVDWVLEAKLELLSRLLEQGPDSMDVEAALNGLEEKLRRVLNKDADVKRVVDSPPSSLIELRNALLPDEPEWARP